MRATLRSRSQARACQQPATEARIVVAVGCSCGVVLRACFCDQITNLARGCGERAVMMVRHDDDQAFEVGGHIELQVGSAQ